MGNMYFKHRSFCNYSRVAIGQGRMEVMSMINLVVVKRDMLLYVQDVRAVRKRGRGLSDQDVVLCKGRLGIIKVKGVLKRARRFRSEKLRKHW